MHSNSRVVVITGASRGIGEAAARHFAERGDRVVLLARDRARLHKLAEVLQNCGGTALALPTDVADLRAVEQAFTAAIDAFGTVDVLVNNAGLIEPIAQLADTDPVAWSRAVDVNLKGVYHGLRCALPSMLAQGGGTVINISSGAATNALEGWSAYCATKAAVLALTRCVHREYADRGIRVLGLSPGTVATDMQTAIRDSGINPVSQLDPSVHIPAEWVAQAIAFLSGSGGDAFLGEDFSLKNDEGRALVGLPPVGSAAR
jgi:NAD(P)-dependent dehydrogenase (short-subunit alcohol dehydrogenase family)